MLAIQGVVVSQEIVHVNIKGVEIPVIFEENKTLPIASMRLVFKVAGSIEDGKHPGLSRFVAMVLNEGTKTLGSVGFAKELEQRAINFSVHSGAETLVFEMSSLRETFEFGLEKLNDLLKNPNLSEESIEKVRLMSLGSLSRKENDYDYVANSALRFLMYESTPLAYSSLGTKESIEAISLKTVEEFLKNHLDLSNAIIVLGGNISTDEARIYSNKVIASLPTGSPRKLNSINPSNESKVKILVKPSEQAYIYFGSPFMMASDDEEQYKARVAAFILGESGFGSRLMEEIRVKRGLAYSAYGRISINPSSSKFSGYLQTKNSNKEEAIKIVKEVIASFVENGATKEELEQAKKFLLGSEPLRNETLSQRLSRAFTEYYRGFEPGYYLKELTQIEDLKLEDLNAFIKKHPELNELSIAVVTDADDSRQ